MTKETTATKIDDDGLDTVCGGMVLATGTMLQTPPASQSSATLQDPDTFTGGAPTFGEYTYAT